MKIRIDIDDGKKHVICSVADAQEVVKAAGEGEDAKLFQNLVSFCEDVLDSNVNSGLVEITPQNAAEMLTGKSEPEPAPQS